MWVALLTPWLELLMFALVAYSTLLPVFPMWASSVAFGAFTHIPPVKGAEHSDPSPDDFSSSTVSVPAASFPSVVGVAFGKHAVDFFRFARRASAPVHLTEFVLTFEADLGCTGPGGHNPPMDAPAFNGASIIWWQSGAISEY